MENENQMEVSQVQAVSEPTEEILAAPTPQEESSQLEAQTNSESLEELLTTPAQKIVNQMPYSTLTQMGRVAKNQMEALNIMSLTHAYCLEKKLIEENDPRMLIMESFIAKEYQAIQALQHLFDIALESILASHPQRPKSAPAKTTKCKKSANTNNSSITNSIFDGMDKLTQKTAANFAKKTPNFVSLFE